MKEKIAKLIESVVGPGVPVELSIPEESSFGHYATNVAMRLAKSEGKKPLELARELTEKIKDVAPVGFFEKVEAAAPGFINFWLAKGTIQKEFETAAKNKHFGANEVVSERTVMVEFTDPNPFKLFHIGHLMSNAIGESFSRLHEAAGARVLRVNYQGDLGMHVAKAVWGIIEKGGKQALDEQDGLPKKVAFLGDAYALGSTAYEERPEAKDAIVATNKKIYSREDSGINALYDLGRKLSLDYLETIYERLGTKFNHYFFESEIGEDGLKLVRERKDIFKESDGAIIFPGEEYGLHTRVFINSQGLPTYEAKELGLNKKKFELYPVDVSIIVTGNEIKEYFKVLLKAMELVIPDIAFKTRHVPHGMLRLPSGKMSSRKGSVVTAEALIQQAAVSIEERMKVREDMTAEEKKSAVEAIAIGAIKYSILRQNPGQDIIFDFDQSLSFEGDSGPYLQYAYARLRSILRKTAEKPDFVFEKLDSDIELLLMRKIFEFPDVVLHATEVLASNVVAGYIYKLAVVANRFYETTPILKDEDADRRAARLGLVEVAARTIKDGLALLGIKALEKI